MKSIHLILLCGFTCLSLTACKNAVSHTKEARIDFAAYLPQDAHAGADSSGSLLLRVQLMGSKTDLIKYKLSKPEEQQKRLEYYLLQFSKDIRLISGTDTLPCIDSHMEQLYMDLPYRTFLLNFGNRVLHTQDQLLIRDIVFSDQFILADINNMPQ